MSESGKGQVLEDIDLQELGRRKEAAQAAFLAAIKTDPRVVEAWRAYRDADDAFAWAFIALESHSPR